MKVNSRLQNSLNKISGGINKAYYGILLLWLYPDARYSVLFSVHTSVQTLRTARLHSQSKELIFVGDCWKTQHPKPTASLVYRSRKYPHEVIEENSRKLSNSNHTAISTLCVRRTFGVPEIRMRTKLYSRQRHKFGNQVVFIKTGV